MAHYFCEVCGIKARSSRCFRHKVRSPIKINKRPKQRGKHFYKWVEFRDEVAIPYLDKRYGHVCFCCGVGGKLDVDHIVTRGADPSLRYNLGNLRYACRSCHRKLTDKVECIHG